MDYKLAKELLIHHINTWKDKFASPHFEACEVAIKALEKQIPKLPKTEFNGIETLKICECGGEAYNYPKSFNYCPYCGQRIDLK